MQQIKRDGIEIDRCPVSGGIWLDKGELEKLLAMAQEAIGEDRREYRRYQDECRSEQRGDFGREDVRMSKPQYGDFAYGDSSRRDYDSRKYQDRRDDDRDYEERYHKKYGKRSKVKAFFDLFDFD